jgi:4'-phosphopantetheinyl transferase
MPLLSHQSVARDAQLGIWQIEEPDSFFLDRLGLSASEHEQLAGIKGFRRTEWLAGRYLLHVMSGRQMRGAVLKDEFGKPRLQGSEYDISISHSHGLAAVFAAPKPCGIDIQFLVEKIGRIAHKFMRPEELEALSETHRLEHQHVYWGAKEALYKAYGRRQLDFCRHLIIGAFDYQEEGGIISGRIEKEDYLAQHEIHYRLAEGYMLVWSVEV